jgi:hypothetical protein
MPTTPASEAYAFNNIMPESRNASNVNSQGRQPLEF